MKARVYYSGILWFGEVYADWFFGGEGWRNVTIGCCTKWGATRELKSWLKKHKKYNVNI